MRVDVPPAFGSTNGVGCRSPEVPLDSARLRWIKRLSSIYVERSPVVHAGIQGAWMRLVRGLFRRSPSWRASVACSSSIASVVPTPSVSRNGQGRAKKGNGTNISSGGYVSAPLRCGVEHHWCFSRSQAACTSCRSASVRGRVPSPPRFCCLRSRRWPRARSVSRFQEAALAGACRAGG